MADYEAEKDKMMKGFCENLIEQHTAGEARMQLLKEERMGRKKRMKESILHPISDPYGKIGRATRIAKYAGTGGVIGGFVGGKKGAGIGAATGALAGHLVNQTPYYAKDVERTAQHIGHATKAVRHELPGKQHVVVIKHHGN
jgi:hypothetical protein